MVDGIGPETAAIQRVITCRRRLFKLTKRRWKTLRIENDDLYNAIRIDRKRNKKGFNPGNAIQANSRASYFLHPRQAAVGEALIRVTDITVGVC